MRDTIPALYYGSMQLSSSWHLHSTIQHNLSLRISPIHHINLSQEEVILISHMANIKNDVFVPFVLKIWVKTHPWLYSPDIDIVGDCLIFSGVPTSDVETTALVCH
jgi:CII-binding regulator of phage lambda lysogenization HflD